MPRRGARPLGAGRSGVAGPAVAAWVCAAALLAGCGSPSPGAPSPTGSPGTASITETPDVPVTVTPSPTATAMGTTAGTPSVGGPAASDWKSFTTSDGTLTFDIPASWIIKDPAGELAEGGGAFVEVSNPAGKLLATLRTNMATGSTCTERYPYGVLDKEPLPALAQAGTTPRFVFEQRSNPALPDREQMPVFGYGIVTAPEPTGDTACPIFHFFTWPPNAAMFSGVYDPFDTTPGNEPHVDTVFAYMETAEYRNIRKMITSLRPAGK